MLKECLRDDAAIWAEAIVGLPFLVAYVVASWLLVFPAMLALRRRCGRVLAPAVVGLLFAAGLAAPFHRPEIDGTFINTTMHLVLWLAGAWFAGGVVAATLWPNDSLHPTRYGWLRRPPRAGELKR